MNTELNVDQSNWNEEMQHFFDCIKRAMDNLPAGHSITFIDNEDPPEERMHYHSLQAAWDGYLGPVDWYSCDGIQIFDQDKRPLGWLRLVFENYDEEVIGDMPDDNRFLDDLVARMYPDSDGADYHRNRAAGLKDLMHLRPNSKHGEDYRECRYMNETVGYLVPHENADGWVLTVSKQHAERWAFLHGIYYTPCNDLAEVKRVINARMRKNADKLATAN